MIYDNTNARLLIGCIMKQPSLLKNDKVNLSKKDFTNDFHRVLFNITSFLLENNAQEINTIDISSIADKSPKVKKVLDANKYIDAVPVFKQLANIDNFDLYYNAVKRCTLLREMEEDGISVDKYENSGQSIEEIVNDVELCSVKYKREFIIDSDDTTRKKAGDKGEEILAKFKEKEGLGLSFECKHLTTLWGGFRKQQLYIRSSDTGGGKSRSCIADITGVCAEKLWDEKTQQWKKNPNGKHRALYVGCEMELEREVEPLLWAYMTCIDSSDIMEGNTTPEQDARIMEAIDMLKDDCLWLTDMPAFNIEKLEAEIKEHKLKYGIEYVAFDYILLSNELSIEFAKNRGKMSSRGDEALLDLSKALKDLAKKYDVGIITSTQTNADIKDYRQRDYQVIRGGKAISDKCSGASISMPITPQELELVKPYYESGKFNMNAPNFVETVYKSRFSKYPKECKIFSNYNLGTMRKTPMFVTDKNFNLIDVPKTVVRMEVDDE